MNQFKAIVMKDHAVAIEAYAKRIQNRCQKIKEDAGEAVHALRIISPTGMGVRKDSQGSGEYKASRLGTDKWGNKKYHKGNDYLCVPGQDIVCPIYGARIARIAKPYSGEHYSGLEIGNGNMTIHLYYIDPDKSLIGKNVHMGDTIGIAQDITKRYSPGMEPHIHLQIMDMDADLLRV